MTQSSAGFTLVRTLPGPPERVFAAWTDPEHLAWFYNPAMPQPAGPIEVDLRVGGRWRQQMLVNPTLQYPTGGIYLDIIPAERITFRWGAVGGWPEHAGDHEADAPVVDVQLDGEGDGTRMTLTVRFPGHLAADEVRELIDGGTRAGWSATIDRLEASTAFSTPG